MTNEIRDTFSGPTLAPLLRRSMMMGSDPVISMMAKSTMNALMISLKLKLISLSFLVPQKYNNFLYLQIRLNQLKQTQYEKENRCR